MAEVFPIILPIFFVIGLGYLCAKLEILNSNSQQTLSSYVFYFALPCYMFIIIANTPKETILNLDYILSFAIAMFSIALLSGCLTYYLYKLSSQETIIATMAGCYTNSNLFGIPIVAATFNNLSPIILVAMFQIIVVGTLIISTLTILKKDTRLSCSRICYELSKLPFVNPIILGALLGVLFSYMNWQVPETITNCCKLIGSASIPTALFALGLTLGNYQYLFTRKSKSNSNSIIYVLIFIKLLVHPFLAWLIGHYVFHLETFWIQSLVVVSAMPTAVNNFIFAQRYKAFAEEASKIVFLSSILSFLTLTFLLTVLPFIK